MDLKNGKFSGNPREYDDWAEKIASHWASRHRNWPGQVFPEDLKISQTADYLDDAKRKTWTRMQELTISDKEKLFTMREYLIYFRTYWGQKRDTEKEQEEWMALKQTGSAQSFIRLVRQRASELTPQPEMTEIIRVIVAGLKKDVRRAMSQHPKSSRPNAQTATIEWMDWIIDLDQANYTRPRRDRLNAAGTNDEHSSSSSDADNSDDDLSETTLNAIRGALKNRRKRSDKPTKNKKGNSRARNRRRDDSGKSRSRSRSPEKQPKCWYCEKRGHISRNCLKKKADKEKEEKEKEKKEQKDKRKEQREKKKKRDSSVRLR